MKTTRYDGRCPHCCCEILNLDHLHVNYDYMTDFDFDCPDCEKKIGVHVTMVPEFSLCSETNEEAERRAWEQSRKRHEGVAK